MAFSIMSSFGSQIQLFELIVSMVVIRSFGLELSVIFTFIYEA